MYPNDSQYEDSTISRVSKTDSGWSVTRADGWSLFVPGTSPVVPAVGMSIRYYGEGIGRPIRGLFIDGQKVYYYTADQYADKCACDMYGTDAAD